MSDRLIEDGSFINSIIGEGTSFKGDLELSGLLRIDGDFCGTIRTTDKVLIGKSGRAECTIRTGTVVIGGVVKGNIYAEEKVIILSTGMMMGNISTPRLIAEEGVILNGNCLVRNQGGTAERESGELRQVHGGRETGSGVDGPSTPVLPDASRRRKDNLVETEAKSELSPWKG